MRLLDCIRRRRIAHRRGLWRLRIFVGAALTALMVARPVPLTSVRWWHVPRIVVSIGLSDAQRQTIDQLYESRSHDRRRCIERLVEASNQVDQFMRDGDFGDDLLRSTQAAMRVAAEERLLRRRLTDDIVRVLSQEQHARLASILAGDSVE